MTTDRTSSRRATRAINRLLLAASDPEPRGGPVDATSILEAHGTAFFAQAAAHGVLPAVVHNLCDELTDERLASVLALATRQRREVRAHTGLLDQFAGQLLAAADGLPVTLVKGRAFAERLYPSKALRSFTDIDFLAAPSAVPALSRILETNGFRFAAWDYHPERQEAKWMHTENAALVVEVHTNLVHHPGMRRAISLAYSDLADEPQATASHLAIALVHGAMHQYERLCQVVDILQAVRTLKRAEEARFERIIIGTGSRLAAVVGLELAGRMFNEPRCKEIMRTFGSVRYARPARALIRPEIALSTKSSTRWLHSWRRKSFRALLKRSAAGNTAERG